MARRNKNITFEKSKQIGERFKNEARKRGYKNSELATLLHYSDGHQISALFSGKNQLQEDSIKILSKEFGVREEYLKCEDDYPTIEDAFKVTHNEELKKYSSAINYLSTLGLELIPGVYWHCTRYRELTENYPIMKQFISNEDNEKINRYLENTFSAFGLDETPEEFSYIELNSNPYDNMVSVSDLTKDNGIYSEDFDINKFWEKNVEVMYKAKFNGETIGHLDMYFADMFFKNIDALCKATIMTLIVDGLICSESNRLMI